MRRKVHTSIAIDGKLILGGGCGLTQSCTGQQTSSINTIFKNVMSLRDLAIFPCSGQNESNTDPRGTTEVIKEKNLGFRELMSCVAAWSSAGQSHSPAASQPWPQRGRQPRCVCTERGRLDENHRRKLH